MKTRTITKYRWVPHTVDGETELIREPYTIDVPVPPADWDQRVRAAVTAVAGVLVTASVVWSTASIGELLARMVTVGAAYFAAITFDSLWIMCTAVEWLLRAEPDRAQKARAGGIVALIVAMGAVFANGYLAGQPIIGAVGAAVSALAKGATALAMAVHARPLDARTRQWVAKRRASLNGQLAMIPIRRELQRGLGVLEAERAALGTDPGSAEEPGSTDPELSGDPEEATETPDAKVSAIRSGRVTTQEAVRNAWDSGIREPEAVLRTVRKSTGRDVPQSSVDRYLRALRVGA